MKPKLEEMKDIYECGAIISKVDEVLAMKRPVSVSSPKAGRYKMQTNGVTSYAQMARDVVNGSQLGTVLLNTDLKGGHGVLVEKRLETVLRSFFPIKPIKIDFAYLFDPTEKTLKLTIDNYSIGYRFC
jgi:hypothetical protein